MEKGAVPRHVAIIMDGNGRWAEQRGLPRVEGHRQGSLQVIKVMEAAQEAGVEYLTLYAFSTENWKRPPTEVAALMRLLEEFIDDRLPELMERGVRLLTMGRPEQLPFLLTRKIDRAIRQTAGNTKGTIIIALNYGGRAEIVDAVGKLLADPERKGNKVTEEEFRRYLYCPEVPDPELLIRTSGELRLSNFLLWQLSYSEIYVTDTLWPDFGKTELDAALEVYGGRKRRFGGR